jgi:light-regulated signal transduction histidine kinase (bacteriophytochrome)
MKTGKTDATTLSKLPEALSPIQRYGLAFLAVSIALGGGLVADRFSISAVGFPLFLFAIALTVWHAGSGPGILALILSSLAFDYYLTEPVHTFYVTRSEFPYYIIFVLFASLLTWFSTVRRRTERDLRQSRDALGKEVIQRRALNEELAKRSGELQATNKELEAFAYSVSHDLRAPVRHIAGFTELLQKHSEAVLDDKSRRYISMILGSAKRMGTLIDDLLAFSRIGRAETQNTTIRLDELIKGVVGEIAPDTHGRNIVWRIGRLPICYGDPSMFRLLFANLVSNAVKFTRTRADAEIQIDSLNQKPGEVVVFVKDNGVGFDMKYSDKLFGVFQRLHSQEAFEGTGIGLATVQRIVHRHGGRVWGEGSINHGATFYVALPKPGDMNT